MKYFQNNSECEPKRISFMIPSSLSHQSGAKVIHLYNTCRSKSFMVLNPLTHRSVTYINLAHSNNLRYSQTFEDVL